MDSFECSVRFQDYVRHIIALNRYNNTILSDESDEDSKFNRHRS